MVRATARVPGCSSVVEFLVWGQDVAGSSPVTRSWVYAMNKKQLKIDGPGFMTVKEVAARLNVSEFYVRTLITEGKLKGYKLPGKGRNAPLRICPKSVDAMLAEAEILPQSTLPEFRRFRQSKSRLSRRKIPVPSSVEWEL